MPTASDSLPDLVNVIPALGVPGLLALAITAWARNLIYTRATYNAMVTEKDAQIRRLEAESDAKTAALERKDVTIQDLQAGMLDKAIPALARATLVLEHWHTDTTVRRSE